MPRDGGVARNVQGDRIETAPRAIGGDHGLTLIQGLSGTLRSVEAAQREVASVAREMRVLNERTIKLAERPRRDSQAELLRGVRDAVADGMKEAMAGVASPDRPRKGRTKTPDTSSEPSDAPTLDRLPPAQGGRLSNYEMYERGRGYDIGKLRQDVARGIGRRVSEWHAGALQQAPVKLTTVPGQPDLYGVPLPPGMAGPPTPISPDQAQSLGRRARAVGNVKELAGAAASGESGAVLKTLTGMLPRGAGMALGVTTGAAMLANQAVNFATEQRAANAQWQSILGGSNAEGFRERIRSQMFGFGLKGTMGAGEASRLYRGVAETGLRGADRTLAQDFAVDSYKDLGMAVDDSMEIIKIASRTGQESLRGVAEALVDVTKAAREAEVNTDEARKKFTENFAIISETVGGASAAALAGGITTSQAQLGRQFQGVSMGGMLAPNQLRIMAARSGMPFGQLYAATMRRDQAGTQQVASLLGRRLAETAQLNLGSRGMDIVRRYTDENRSAPNRPLSPAQYEELSALLLEQVPGLDPEVAQQTLASMGMGNVPLPEAIGMLARIQSGDYNPAGEVMERVQNSKAYRVEDRTGGMLEDRKGVTDIGDVQEKVGMNRGQAMHTGGRWGPFGEKKADRARSLYVKSVQRTGTGSPIIEAALKSGFDPSWRFRVQTADGPRVMTFDDLMRFAPDQAARGDVEIVQGRGEGGTLADVTHMAVDTSVKATSARRATKKGKDEEDFEAKRGGGGGRVIIAPSPALGRWLTFQGSGTVVIDPNAPPPPPTSPSGRASGNP